MARCLWHGRRPFGRTADFFWMFCSCVGVWQNDRVEIIANDQGNRTTPSYVGFTDTERLIGDAAKNQVAMNPRNTVFDAKRLIGRKFDDTAVQQDMKHWPFAVIKGPDGKPIIEGKCCSPTLLAGFIRKQVATAACPFLKVVRTILLLLHPSILLTCVTSHLLLQLTTSQRGRGSTPRRSAAWS